jgi:hypothetical protein
MTLDLTTSHPRAEGQETPAAPLPGLFVCCVHGLDARRLDPATTPFLSGLRADCPTTMMRTLPSSELLTTLLTGVYPSEHGVWQVRLKPEGRLRRPQRLLDRLPDAVSTTIQGFRQIFEPTFDLALVPARRRRDFEMHRFKYFRRERDHSVVERIGDYDSLFGVLGERSRFHFVKSFGGLRKMESRVPSGGCALEFLEMYALDLFQHWHMDRAKDMDRAYARVDRFIAGLDERCRRKGITLLVVSDHGQERVLGTIPLKRELARSGVPETDYTYFLEVVQARFWFRTPEARQRLTAILRLVPHTRAFQHHEMGPFHVPHADDSYGELHVVADPGWIFFPHDFYHPLANFFMGLTEDTQRTRLLGSRHRANHGYLPEHPSELGFAILADRRFRAARPEIELIDVAPTVLALLGEARPESMRGSIAFVR